MDDLLTTRQVQDILKVDRITIYRMLQDGRLKGVKIGQQWRFPNGEVDRLLSNSPATHVNHAQSGQPAGSFQHEASDFPTHCIQTIQDLFSNVAQVGALVIDTNGIPLTDASSPCRFCQILWENPSALQACQASWKSFIEQSQDGSKYFPCFAGLQYITAPIRDQGELVGLFLAGPFYWQPPNLNEETERLNRLANLHQLPLDSLLESARSIPVIPAVQHERAASWPVSAAHSIETILFERKSFMSRLQQIASLTHMP